jgi:hypothetical protein
MARYKTKKQKKKIAQKVAPVKSNPSSIEQSIKISKKTETQTTVFSDSQVKLLYGDLFKTLVVTIIVFAVLLSIFFYMR